MPKLCLATSLASAFRVSKWTEQRIKLSSTGNRAAEAHYAAASESGAVVLNISSAQKQEADGLQAWLSEIYDSLDYEAALAAAEVSPQPYDSIDDEGTTYGEFPIDFFLALFEKLDPSPDTHFIDLGSGRGQIVLAASRSRRWASCQGIEILPELHFIAYEASRCLVDKPCPISFKLDDIYSADISSNIGGKPCLVFVYATCLEVDVTGSLARLSKALEAIPTGSTILTVNRPLVRGDGRYELTGMYRGPNPESEADGLLSTAYVWSKQQ